MTNPHDNAPYLGLRPFTESEKDKFFGRDEEIHILTDKILAHRLTLLVAASGVGKSSLLQAGVMPQLRASGMADLIYHNDWAVDPARDLKHSIVKHFIQQQRVTADYAPDLDQPLNEFLQTHALLGIGTVVILLDQFEEFFYYQKFSPQRDQFIQQLAAALHDSDTPTAFVFSMREDFAMEMEAFKPFFKGIFDNIYRIEKLELPAARAAILKPIAAIGYHYQPALLEQLLADLGRRERNERLDLQHTDQAALTEARVEPPHLQIVCQQLWQHAHESASQEITLEHYQHLGKAEGILSSYFNDKMAKLDRAQQRLASRAFDLLVSQHGAKMAYPLDELAKLLRENPDTLQTSLDQLQAAAILRRIQRQGKPWYELYHDIFAKSITEWNQAYKKKQLREQLLKRGGVISAVLLSILLAFDGWENHQQRHFRLGQETVSDRVEVYQGKLGSWDIFGQRKFLYESDFERKDIEADKRVAAEGMAERDNSVEMQIGELPLRDRFFNYAQAGLFDSADRVFESIRQTKDDRLIGDLLSPLASFRVQQSIDRLLNWKSKRGAQNGSGLSWLGSLNGQLTIPKLVDLLADNDADVRSSATYPLIHLKAVAAIPKLITLLEDKDDTVRNSAASALGSLKAEAAIPKLIALLADNDAYVRNTAAEALRKLKAEAATPRLIALLTDKDANVRSTVAWALGNLKAEAAIPKLITLLADNETYVRNSAGYALGNLKAEAVIPNLITLLADKSADKRGSAAYALGNLKAVSAIPKLITLLEDKDIYVRNMAASALGNLKAEAAVPKLIALLPDNETSVRISAAGALGILKAEAAIPKLITLFEDNNPEVRSTAAEALGNFKFPTATLKLSLLLSDNSWSVRGSAMYALGKIKDPAATPNLIALFAKRNTDYNDNRAEVALRNLNLQLGTVFKPKKSDSAQESSEPTPTLDSLRVDAAGMNPNRRAEASTALGTIKQLAAAELLGKLLQDRDTDVVSNTLKALAKLGKTHSAWVQPYLLQLLAYTKHTDGDIQEAAIQVLGGMITFANGQKSSDFIPLDQHIQQTLLGIAQDAKQKPFLRMAAVDALGDTKREDAGKVLLPLLADPQLNMNVAYWLAQLAYRPAQAELQAHFDSLVQQNQAWRAARDAGKFARADKEELTAQKDNSWQDDYQLYQYAYALARIAPEKDGVALLSHPLYQVRQAAVQALAEKANGALLQQVLAAHQAFNASDLPSPFPTTAYRALDKMLYQLEFNGTKADLALLKTLKAKNFPAQPKQQRALNERFDWTIAELEYRLGKK
ncbi:MAG: HEAT repeat domain-containing protein [Gallionella sp.]|nr:HEAT repeat domain-containing protein [Gallionella sp.]